MDSKSAVDESARKKWYDNVSPWKKLMARQTVNTILLLGIFLLAAYVIFWVDTNNIPSQILQALKNCRANGAIDTGATANVTDIDSVLSMENINSFCAAKGYDGGYSYVICPVNCYQKNSDGWTRNDCFNFSDVWRWIVLQRSEGNAGV